MEPTTDKLSNIRPMDVPRAPHGAQARETARQPAKARMRRVLLCLPAELLEAVDKEAQCSYTSRSDMIRHALLWYLRPAARARRNVGATEELEPEELYADTEAVYKILQRQKLRAGVRAILREHRRKR